MDRMRTAVAAAALLVLLLGAVACGGGDTSSGVDATGAGAVSVPARAGAETATAAPDGRETSIATITDDVSRLRGLPVLRAIDTAYITREELGVELEGELAGEYPPGEVAVEEKVLKHLGLLDEDADLVELLGGLLGGSILGYYDNQTGELKVVSGTEEISAINEITLAHEITHALQDQSFSITGLLPNEGSGNDDRDLAVLALIEGDATATEESYAAERMGLADAFNLLLESLGTPLGPGPSSYVEHSLTFPYIEGGEFVSVLLKEGGWDAVNRAYADPPQSTEQIMHPQKYLAGEPPVEVREPDIAAALGNGWESRYGTVMGEFDLKEILAEGVSSSRASRAAAGWGGGRLEYLERAGGEQLTALALAWDSVSEADEFTLTMQSSLEEQTGSAFVFAAGRLPGLTTVSGTWVMAQHGSVVALVRAPDDGTGDSVARLILGL